MWQNRVLGLDPGLTSPEPCIENVRSKVKLLLTEILQREYTCSAPHYFVKHFMSTNLLVMMFIEIDQLQTDTPSQS